jgi:hypothetical protein
MVRHIEKQTFRISQVSVTHPDGTLGIVTIKQYFTIFKGREVPAQYECVDDKGRSVEPLKDGNFKVDNSDEILTNND